MYSNAMLQDPLRTFYLLLFCFYICVLVQRLRLRQTKSNITRYGNPWLSEKHLKKY